MTLTKSCTSKAVHLSTRKNEFKFMRKKSKNCNEFYVRLKKPSFNFMFTSR